MYNKFFEKNNYLLPQPGKPDVDQKFQSTDSLENFNYNLKNQPVDWKYRNKEVRYVTNKQYYRTQEWNNIDWKNSVVILGCSQVYGLGLAEDETITFQLQKILDRPVINLGVPSSGPIFAMQNSVLLNKNFPTPWAVINLWSNSYRIHEFVENNQINHYTATSDHGLFSLPQVWGKFIINPDVHSYFAIKAAEAIWMSKTRYHSYSIWEPIEENTKYIRAIFNDYARDMAHPGSETAKLAAITIAKDLS